MCINILDRYGLLDDRSTREKKINISVKNSIIAYI